MSSDLRDKWDKRDRILSGEQPPDQDDKQNINIIPEEHNHSNDDGPVLSGLLCIFCNGDAIYLYKGMSLCGSCLNGELKELIKRDIR